MTHLRKRSTQSFGVPLANSTKPGTSSTRRTPNHPVLCTLPERMSWIKLAIESRLTRNDRTRYFIFPQQEADHDHND